MGFNSGFKVLNPTCHLLALLGAHPILHISRIRVNVVIPGRWGWQANRGGKGRGLGVLAVRLGVRLRHWKKLIFLFWFYYFDLINFILCFHLFRISYLILFLHFSFFFLFWFLSMSYSNSQPARQYTSPSPTATPIGLWPSLLISYQNQLYL